MRIPITGRGVVALAVLLPELLSSGKAGAQDVPGIEICTVEKTMERRTSCLQSNVDFLQKTIARLTADHQQKLDAANRQIEKSKGGRRRPAKDRGRGEEKSRRAGGKRHAAARKERCEIIIPPDEKGRVLRRLTPGGAEECQMERSIGRG